MGSPSSSFVRKYLVRKYLVRKYLVRKYLGDLRHIAWPPPRWGMGLTEMLRGDLRDFACFKENLQSLSAIF
jgi:hypothetical protein